MAINLQNVSLEEEDEEDLHEEDHRGRSIG